jgi:membrane-bound metal-dependent hydrolase YbcI (DUF457 family)
MILWPAGLAVALVWAVFRDPAFDYRVAVLGALLPDLFDGPLGGARVLHTLAAPVAVLVAVMVLTRTRRAARRHWLALPIGMFVHLLADGMWARTETFWWPAFGRDLEGALPALDHGLTVLALQEVAGAALLVWAWRRFRLGDPAVRARFLKAGHLPRDLAR